MKKVDVYIYPQKIYADWHKAMPNCMEEILVLNNIRVSKKLWDGKLESLPRKPVIVRYSSRLPLDRGYDVGELINRDACQLVYYDLHFFNNRYALTTDEGIIRNQLKNFLTKFLGKEPLMPE